LSDSAVKDRAYGAKDGDGVTMSPGMQWKTTGGWESLGQAEPKEIGDVQLTVERATAGETKFTVTWKVGERVVAEAYTINASGVTCVSSITGGPTPAATRVLVPALVLDGVENTSVKVDGKQATVTHRGSVLRLQVDSPAGDVKLDGPTVPAHNGMMRALVADLPDAATRVTWRMTLEP
jgi:hypothetical protein